MTHCSICGSPNARIEIYDQRFPKPFNKVCSSCFEHWSSNNESKIMELIKLKLTPQRLKEQKK